ncbi:hypothetical protein ES703_40874 [subsurface metagenome]
MSKIKIRLKEEVGSSLIVSTPSTSINIGVSGDYDPEGFEIDREIYEKYLKPYTELVTKKQKKREVIEQIDLEE